MTSEIELAWDPAAAAAIFNLGGVAAAPRPVARGAMGWIWRLETSRGIWAVKQPFEVAGAEHVEREVGFVRRAREAGVMAPAIITTASGEALAYVSGRAGPVPLRVYEWIDATRPLESPVAVTDALRAGETLAMMHTAGETTDEEPDDWYRRLCVGGPWTSTEMQLRGAGEPELADAISDSMDLLRTLENLVVDERVPNLICHRDFNPENVLVDAADRFVILDWENAGPMGASAEIAYALLSWTVDATSGECDCISTREFFDGYASRLRLPVPSGPAVFSVAVVTHLNYINVVAGIVTDPSSSTVHDMERARPLLMEVLRGLPTSSLLEHVLEHWYECATKS